MCVELELQVESDNQSDAQPELLSKRRFNRSEYEAKNGCGVDSQINLDATCLHPSTFPTGMLQTGSDISMPVDGGWGLMSGLGISLVRQTTDSYCQSGDDCRHLG